MKSDEPIYNLSGREKDVLHRALMRSVTIVSPSSEKTTQDQRASAASPSVAAGAIPAQSEAHPSQPAAEGTPSEVPYTPFAYEEVHKFYEEWPGGLDEIESSLKQFRKRAETAEAALSSQQRETQADKERLDWLDQGMCGLHHVQYGDYRHYSGGPFNPIREVIDAARTQSKEPT